MKKLRGKLGTIAVICSAICIVFPVFADTPNYDAQYDDGRISIPIMVGENSYLGGTENDPGIADKLASATINSTKDIIQNYCNIILLHDEIAVVGEDSQTFLYDPRQSLFVMTMCMDINQNYERFFPYLHNEDGDYMQQYHLSGFGMPTEEGEVCSYLGDMTRCELHTYIPDFFNELIDNYINIKQANILGLKTPIFTEDEGGITIEDQSNMLMQEYFYDKMLCDTKGEKDSACNYPKTMKKVEDFLRGASKLIKQNQMINYDQIYLDSRDENRLDRECGQARLALAGGGTSEYNIVMCGLVGEETDHMLAFMNALYNELFYYRLFVTFYTTQLDINLNLSSQSDPSKALKQQYDYKARFNQELKRSEDAIDLSLVMLKEMYFAYPLHIGFMLYHEDLITLRKELVKIVTPISTLYDKLRNAQEKKD